MEVLKGNTIREMLVSASNHLQNQCKYINDLNIFPVPDGDTGTNMGMTFRAAAEEAIQCPENAGAGAILEALAKSSLRNARGNSGVILSQILRGLATGVKGKESLDVETMKNAAKLSRDTAYRAVMKPTEGTILTIVREMAEFAEENAGKYQDAIAFLKALTDAAKASLDKTPEILPVLKQAGVVDAGGMGVYTLLEGALLAAEGTPVALKEGGGAVKTSARTEVATEREEIKFLYCTEFLIQKKPERRATQLKEAIRSKGDCMLVIEDDEIVKVHIHTNHPGFVIEQALKLGELTNLKIDNMKYQHEEKVRTEEAPPVERKKYGVVAVSAGEGLSEVFRSVGVDEVVEGGQTMNPSTQDLLDAVQKIPADTVFILPNNKNIILAADQVDALTDQEVKVLPTKNIPQGISAMLAFQMEAETQENFDAMWEMASMVQCGQITFAARNSTVDDWKIRKNDIMGMLGSKITCLGKDVNQVAEELVQSMVNDESGMVTVYYGADISKEQAEALEKTLVDHYEYLDVSLIYGGQPVYYYMIAVE